jgi:hypothetical protein
MRKIAHTSRRTRRLAVVAIAGVTAALALPAANANATIFATTTTITASPATSIVGTPVTLTAKVSTLLNLAVPHGPVTFTSNNAAGKTATLGTVSLASCSSSPCTATITTPLMLGTTSVTASYAAEGLTAKSAKSVAVKVNPNPTPGTSQSVDCYAGQTCATGTIKSSDNTTTLVVSSSASSGDQTTSGSLTSGTLHCAPAAPDGEGPDGDGDDDDGVYVGALATFSSTAPDSTKTITYTGTGATGTTMKHQYNEHPAYVSCYGQDTPWNGYTTGVFGPAPFNSEDGLYVAQLPRCGTHSNTLPCVKNVAGSGTTDSYVITTQAGDPKNVA